MAGENLFKKMKGIIGNIFQLDNANDGPNLKNNAGVLEVRNAADSAFAVARGAPAVGGNDFVIKTQLDTLQSGVIVSGQFDGNDPLPANTGTRQYFVVTTTGANASIGDLIYDDGTGTGTAVVLSAEGGRTISIQTTLTGGTVTLDADSIYQWDADGSSGSVQWTKIGDIGSVTNAVKTIRFTVGNTDADSVAQIPAGARIHKTELKITTNYSAGASIQIVDVAGPGTDIILATTDNNPIGGPTPRTYSVEGDEPWTANSAVRADIGGVPAAGAAVVTVFYSEPSV